MGFFLGFRVVDLRLPLTAIARTTGVSSSAIGAAASTLSAGSPSEATSSSDCKGQCGKVTPTISPTYHVLLSRFPFPLSRCIDFIWVCCRGRCCWICGPRRSVSVGGCCLSRILIRDTRNTKPFCASIVLHSLMKWSYLQTVGVDVLNRCPHSRSLK